ncbi:MAG: anaerobic ribonucleoside-triphosphate reductase activating protein [Desulfurivibrio sp.]|nr:anaerobic ribonucleoside-triphosphate reductase activating protein [Desulfurivibrio sp.]
MRIGGFHPVSFNDYPGRVAAVVFTQGCNFRCPYCHNPGLLEPTAPAPYQPEDIFAHLATRRGKLGGVVISGGEPTLQEDIIPFCRRLRELGLAVKIDSNGSRPEVLAQLLAAKVVDYLAMDIKAPLADYGKVAGAVIDPATIIRSLTLIAESGIAHHFRTTFVQPLLTAAGLKEVARLVPTGSRHQVQPCRPPAD